jgi:hypothetical protein
MSASTGGNLIDASGAMTAGGTSQVVQAADPNRQYMLVQNISAEDMWINFGVAAVQDKPSIKLSAGSSMQYSVGGTGIVPTGSINIVSATTGSKFVAKTF